MPAGAGRGIEIERRTRYEDRAAAAFLLGAIPVLVLGLAQHATGNSILPEVDPDARYLRVIYVEFVGGGRRANSIFSSGWAFGEYALFACLLSLGMLLQSRVRTIAARVALVGVLGLGLYAIYATLTRSVYLQAGISLLAIFLIARTRRRSGLIVVIMMVTGLLATVGAAYLALSYRSREGASVSRHVVFLRAARPLGTGIEQHN